MKTSSAVYFAVFVSLAVACGSSGPTGPTGCALYATCCEQLANGPARQQCQRGLDALRMQAGTQADDACMRAYQQEIAAGTCRVSEPIRDTGVDARRGDVSISFDAGHDVGRQPRCGDGVVDPGEACDGNCPTSCADGNACTYDQLLGSAQNCTARCVPQPITRCLGGDGCCASGCNATNDSDCTAQCGNGVREGSETCDGNCVTSCSDSNACTVDRLTGSASTCDVQCMRTNISMCTAGDGCCPSACNSTSDSDCSARCGNGVLEGNEVCDGPSCPSFCDDNNACTANFSTGSRGNCNLVCRFDPVVTCRSSDGCCAPGCNATNDNDCTPVCGNNIIESRGAVVEICDGNCPTTCSDNNACTQDTLSGSVSACTARCSNIAITFCRSGDGCCAPGCYAGNDSDCASVCGNRLVEPGETCDGNCATSCSDGSVCTQDQLQGSPTECNVRCASSAVSACQSGDGCCASGCTSLNDSDCSAPCSGTGCGTTIPGNWSRNGSPSSLLVFLTNGEMIQVTAGQEQRGTWSGERVSSNTYLIVNVGSESLRYRYTVYSSELRLVRVDASNLPVPPETELVFARTVPGYCSAVSDCEQQPLPRAASAGTWLCEAHLCRFAARSSCNDTRRFEVTPMSTVGAPPLTGGQMHAVGNKVLVFHTSSSTASWGAIYDIDSDSWSPMSMSGAPTYQSQYVATPTGVVGVNGLYIYTLATNSWRTVACANGCSGAALPGIAVGDQLWLNSSNWPSRIFAASLTSGATSPTPTPSIEANFGQIGDDLLVGDLASDSILYRQRGNRYWPVVRSSSVTWWGQWSDSAFVDNSSSGVDVTLPRSGNRFSVSLANPRIQDTAPQIWMAPFAVFLNNNLNSDYGIYAISYDVENMTFRRDTLSTRSRRQALYAGAPGKLVIWGGYETWQVGSTRFDELATGGLIVRVVPGAPSPTTCTSGDGCCAPGCNSTNDSDCRAVCGNGVTETPETCDGASCPSSCDDSNPCTTDRMSGDWRTCNVACTHTAIAGCLPMACTPNCGDRTCGSDGCGGLCGQCLSGQTCNTSGQCAGGGGSCTPSCGTRECGSNGCGGSCGSCGAEELCSVQGQCLSTSCDPVDNIGCTSGNDCFLLGNETPVCAASGLRTEGSSCSASNLCRGGLGCFAGTCRRLCNRNGFDCRSGETCSAVTGWSTHGTCSS